MRVLETDTCIELLRGNPSVLARREVELDAVATTRDADLMIAAVTIARGATLVTDNLRYYNRIDGLPLEDWIRPPPASAAVEPETGRAPTAADSLPHDD